MSFTTPVVLSSLNGSTGFRLDGVAQSDYTGWSVASAGDVNGDEFADVIVGAFQADQSGTDAGSSYVVFGRSSGWTSPINLSTLNGTTGFRLAGVAGQDYSGYSVGTAGDVNGDGFADLIVGAYQADPNGISSGSSYVVFGRASGWGATVNLANLDGTTGFRLDGVAASDLSGASVASAGDVNGDGFADLIVGAYQAKPNGNSSGSSYVVFGKTGSWSPTLNLSTLNGTTGFRLDGVAAFDLSGYSVASAGDVNGDGFADLIIGAIGADPNGGASGSSYVVFGKTGNWSPTLNLSTLNGTTGFRLDGVAAGDSSGYSVASAGDVNGDGFADLIVGAYQADSNGNTDAGSSYVVFGRASGWTSPLNLSTLNGTTGFRLDGVAPGDSSGLSVASAGDVNGDGFADLIVGAYQADPNGSSSGSTYVVFGRAGGWTSTVSLASLDGTIGFRLDGAAANVASGRSVASAGDVDGDGFADLIVGAYQASPNGIGSGSSYVYFSPATGGAVYRGTSLADKLRGTPDADTMNGYGQNDSLFGGAGNDTIDGGAGNDTLDGGAGTDTVSYASATSAVFVNFGSQNVAQSTGGAGTDTLSNFENLIGGSGNDLLTGDANANIIEGGPGSDTINGLGGIDTASFASAASAVFYGLLSQGTAFNTQGAGTDLLSNFENLLGGAFNDTLGGDAGGNLLDGGDGSDVLFGWTGDDTLSGGAGNDTLDGGTGDDSLVGGTGNDTYVVDSAGDVVTENAGEGFDVVFVTAAGWVASANLEAVYLYGSVTLQLGSNGNDVLVCNASGVNGTLDGSGGDDVLWGGGGNDTLTGGTGNDVLRGAAGDDVLIGGTGDDQLVGGVGADVFRFAAAGWGYDQIFDFAIGTDKINLAGAATGFGQLTVYVVGANTAVVLGGDRIDVYGVTTLSASDFLFA